MTQPNLTPVVHFDEVKINDRITFLTRDNGYGGSGDHIERTGTVTRKTDKVVDLYVGGGTHVFERGKDRLLGATARLRKTDWYDRSPRRADRPKCTCGGVNFNSCLCEISLSDFLATSSRKRA